MRARTMWPALILAANRKESVTGRTRVLNDSTITRKGLSQSGAPPGRSIPINREGEYITDEMIRANQIGMAIESVKNKWLDELKI